MYARPAARIWLLRTSRRRGFGRPRHPLRPRTKAHGRGDLVARLSLYEQRLSRTLTQAKAELKQLQQERAEAGKEALHAAARIRNLKQALSQPWQPEQDGFEFSTGELARWMRRRQVEEEADDFHYHGDLPSAEAAPAP